jgi:LDH2 family malate/lactate/ureidoglycolate dehydrogenase
MPKTYSVDTLAAFVRDLFAANGCPAQDAAVIARDIVSISAAGIDTHGLNRVPVYINAIQKGRINNRPQIKVEGAGSVFHVDADNAMGHLAAKTAMDKGIAAAKANGISVVYVRHSNHFGAAYEYCRQAADQNVASFIFTNAPIAVAPFGGSKPYYGTNPISMGFPHKDWPIIVDLATSAAARGKLQKAKEEGRSIPEGWALDAQGRATTDPVAGLAGVLLPMAGPKGYALATAVELFSGVYPDAALSPDVGYLYDLDETKPTDSGHTFIFLSLDQPFLDAGVADRTQALVDDVKAVPPAQGFNQVLMPGEDRYIVRSKRLQEGIPVADNLLAQLDDLAAKAGVAPLDAR